jgi:myo-inositol-1(or 4)-monophosphatase
LQDASSARPSAALAAIARDSALLIDTVREAGALALSLFRTDVRNWTKEGSSPVSDADLATNDLIRSRLQAATPDYGWLSEESVDDETRLGRSLVWIIDPIDGTRGYLAGREDWCVSAALVENGSPLIGAVFAPATKEFMFAARGQGASLNGKALAASTGINLEPARIAGPKPLVNRLGLPAGELYPRIGSLALRLCRVADRSLDAAFAAGHSHDWDLAAADLIVHEAGGRMTSLSGDAIVYNRPDATHGMLVAAGRDRHARIVADFRNRSAR